MVSRLIIYYFTGTGNALAVANWIANVALNKGLLVKIEKITPSLRVNTSQIENDTLIGFCYPTHGFNAPPVVIDFILRFPKLKNNVFLLNTRAGMKLYKLFLPGLSGMAQLFPALILKLKGYKLVALQPMDLPSNWISLHPGLRQKVVDSIFQRCERKTRNFAKKILSGEKKFKGLLSLPIDLAISPVSLGYYFFGRFALAKTFVADHKCNNCGLCIKECPVHAIVLKNSRPFWTQKCESCMHCMNSCPQRAIQTPHFFVLLLWWLVFFLFPAVLLKEIIQLFPAFSDYTELVLYLIILLTGLPIIFCSYKVYQFLMKFRFFSQISTFTSLTGYKFWRRYFAPKKYLESSRKN